MLFQLTKTTCAHIYFYPVCMHSTVKQYLHVCLSAKIIEAASSSLARAFRDFIGNANNGATANADSNPAVKRANSEAAGVV